MTLPALDSDSESPVGIVLWAALAAVVTGTTYAVTQSVLSDQSLLRAAPVGVVFGAVFGVTAFVLRRYVRN